MPSPLRLHAALFLVAFLFSANYIISKLAMGAFAPMSFAWLRVLGAAIVLNPLIASPDDEPLDARDRRQLVGFSLLGVVINQSLFLGGLALTSAHVAAILITTIPVFALAAAIVLGLERATAVKVGGIVLAFAGALLVVGREGFGGTAKSLTGDLFIITNSLSYALYLVLSKPLVRRIGPRRLISRIFAIGAVLMLPIAWHALTHQHWRAIPVRAWLALFLVIAGPTVGAYLLSAWALKHADSSLVAAYSYLQPVMTSILAAFYLGERIHPVVIAAALMIFAGVWLSGRPAPPAAREEALPGSPD